MPNWIWVAVMVAAIVLFVYLYFKIVREGSDDDPEFRIQHDHWPSEEEQPVSEAEVQYRMDMQMKLP